MIALPTAAWVVGRLLRRRELAVADLRRSAEFVEQELLTSERLAAAQERVRIARDVHDVVGHSMTAVALQAEAARRLWQSDRARALLALEAVASVARESLTHLGETLALFGASPEKSSHRLPTTRNSSVRVCA
ncbi:MAG: histidine kinase [Thermoleophilia bacterium]|nr:histidine kinase [Thermoleophilia bacterium]